MRTEGSDVVHEDHSDAYAISMDPKGVEPSFRDEWGVEDKAQADEETSDFLKDHDLIDPSTRLGPFVENVHNHRRGVRERPFSYRREHPANWREDTEANDPGQRGDEHSEHVQNNGARGLVAKAQVFAVVLGPVGFPAMVIDMWIVGKRGDHKRDTAQEVPGHAKSAPSLAGQVDQFVGEHHRS